jgi:ubiquinone/menaquinone biosynthesis C-methylase UbiE
MSLVIDLGCGTGRFSELLVAHFGVQVIGIDPSLKMLDQARHKPTIGNAVYCQGLAESLPLRDGCADLVFMSMAYHYFCDPSAVAKECHRLLRQDGYACIRNGTREPDFRQRHFFPALLAMIASDLAVAAGHRDRICSGRIMRVMHQVVTQVIAADWRSFIEKSRYAPTRSWRGCPMTISSKEWRHSGPMVTRSTRMMPVIEETDWFVFTRCG